MAVTQGDLVQANVARVIHTKGVGHRGEVMAKCFDVVGETHRLTRGVEAPGEAPTLSGHPNRAMIGVALLGLDAPDRQHRLTPDRDEVDTHRQRKGRLRARIPACLSRRKPLAHRCPGR